MARLTCSFSNRPNKEGNDRAKQHRGMQRIFRYIPLLQSGERVRRRQVLDEAQNAWVEERGRQERAGERLSEFEHCCPAGGGGGRGLAKALRASASRRKSGETKFAHFRSPISVHFFLLFRAPRSCRTPLQRAMLNNAIKVTICELDDKHRRRDTDYLRSESSPLAVHEAHPRRWQTPQFRDFARFSRRPSR